MAAVRINVPGGAYTIHIVPGGLDQAGKLVAGLGLTPRALVITDDHVAPLYGDKVLASLRRAGVGAELATVRAGEAAKALAVAEELYTKAIRAGVDRRSPVIALGGGVVGDLAGFVAATFQRGVPFIQLPTTLLAQVDSSVGGKVAVNHPLGKNLIGMFYQPRLVLADTGALATLPGRELAAGLAEVLKHGLIAAPALFGYTVSHAEALLACEGQALGRVVERSCEIKADVVMRDEREESLRMILNFGHTIGHALEAATGYAVYRHGEAVAVGMYGAALLSHRLGLCSAATVEAVDSALRRLRLPVSAPGCDPAELLAIASRDKKKIGGSLHWVLLRDIGSVEIRADVPEGEVRAVLAEIT
ncbi:MAG TPA: 3-dehydroquinate synthase [Selenomonadales bacterium]|nr:3-dehydroquinate synthase [Selenomonadales bacterium]